MLGPGRPYGSTPARVPTVDVMQMTAALFTRPGAPLTCEEVTIADPREGEVRVRIAAAGVCHSDYRVLAGEWGATPPLVLGHEGAGVIESVGPGVDHLAPGDTVILSWTPSCGACSYCVAGRPQLCREAVATAYRNVMPDGTSRIARDGVPVYSYLSVGSFAEYAVVPAHGAVRVRTDADLAIAALVGCAVTTGVGASINTQPIRPGERALVIGAGGVGLSVLMGARIQSPSQLVAVDVSDEKLALAAELGATHTINATEVADVVEAVRDLTRGGVDVAYEATGLPTAIEQAYQSLAPGGVAVVVGQVATGARISIDPMPMSGRELTLRGSNYGSARPAIDFQRILDMYVRGDLPLDRLVGDRIKLDGLDGAFQAMAQGRVQGRTVVELS